MRMTPATTAAKAFMPYFIGTSPVLSTLISKPRNGCANFGTAVRNGGTLYALAAQRHPKGASLCEAALPPASAR